MKQHRSGCISQLTAIIIQSKTDCWLCSVTRSRGDSTASSCNIPSILNIKLSTRSFNCKRTAATNTAANAGYRQRQMNEYNSSLTQYTGFDYQLLSVTEGLRHHGKKCFTYKLDRRIFPSLLLSTATLQNLQQHSSLIL